MFGFHTVSKLASFFLILAANSAPMKVLPVLAAASALMYSSSFSLFPNPSTKLYMAKSNYDSNDTPLHRDMNHLKNLKLKRKSPDFKDYSFERFAQSGQLSRLKFIYENPKI